MQSNNEARKCHLLIQEISWRKKSNKMGVKVIQLLLLMVHKLSLSKVFLFSNFILSAFLFEMIYYIFFYPYIMFFVSFENATKTRSSTSNIYYCFCTKEISAVKIDNYVSWHKEHFLLMNGKEIKVPFKRITQNLNKTWE